jgi:hypothetical protein
VKYEYLPLREETLNIFPNCHDGALFLSLFNKIFPAKKRLVICGGALPEQSKIRNLQSFFEALATINVDISNFQIHEILTGRYTPIIRLYDTFSWLNYKLLIFLHYNFAGPFLS